MRKYEVMYILDQDTKPEGLKEVKTKLTNILTTNGGKIEEEAEWGLIDFAYEINHKKKGYYFVLIVNTTAENIAEFQRVSGIDKNVVREMVINTENEQDYVQSTKLSKTDMSIFEEEKRERKPFRKNFNSNYQRSGEDGNTRSSYQRPNRDEDSRDNFKPNNRQENN